MELKKVEKNYHLELNFDELEVVYHALAVYSDGLYRIMSMQLGVRLTGGQVAYWRKADELIRNMQDNEVKLYHCIGFEGDCLPSEVEK